VADAIAADGLVERVLLFGSVARGEASPESDIDLAVIVADSCDCEDVRRLTGFAQRSAREATGCPVDVLVRRRSDFDYLARNVSASIEAVIAEQSLVLHQTAPPDEEVDASSLGEVPRDNIELAGRQAESAVHSIKGVRAEIASVSTEEAEIAVGYEDADETRRSRYARILETSHMALEQCFRAVSSAAGGKSLGSGHELDLFFDKMDDGPEKRALAVAVTRLRDSDGHLRTWRLTSYTLSLDEWRDEMTAANASAHIEATVECAQIAAASIEARSPEKSPAAMNAVALLKAASRLSTLPCSPQELEIGPSAGREQSHPLLDMFRRRRKDRPRAQGGNEGGAPILPQTVSAATRTRGLCGRPTSTGEPCRHPAPVRGKKCPAGHKRT
jgi:predicted nucleotidyltransferase